MGFPFTPAPVRLRSRARSEIRIDDEISLEDWDRRREPGSAIVLYGLTGSIKAAPSRAERRSDVLTFEPRPQENLQQIRPDTVPLKTLFMLATGGLPLRQEGQFFSLFGRSEEDDDDSIYSESSGDDDNERFVPQQTLHHRPRQRARRPSATLIAYELVEITNRDPALIEMSRPFHAENAEVFALSRVRRSQSTMSKLEGYATLTYVPAESPWIRLPPADRDRISRGWQGYDSTYISRPDSQAIASALLNLNWHPEGYILGMDVRGLGLRFLTNVSYRLQPILSRLLEGSNSLGLSDDNRTKLEEALAPVLRIVPKDRVYPTRTYSQRLFNLDTVLAALGEQDDRSIISTIIGVLMISNEEFQMLLYQSMRHIQRVATSTVEINIQAGTMTVPSAFGVMQTFNIDMDRIDSGSLSRSPEALIVSYPTVILAATKACLRSVMLRDSFNASSLFQAVHSWDEIVYVQ